MVVTVPANLPGDHLDLVERMLVGQLLHLVGQALGATAPAVVYHELRRGKEGVAIEDLAAVFE